MEEQLIVKEGEVPDYEWFDMDEIYGSGQLRHIESPESVRNLCDSIFYIEGEFKDSFAFEIDQIKYRIEDCRVALEIRIRTCAFTQILSIPVLLLCDKRQTEYAKNFIKKLIRRAEEGIIEFMRSKKRKIRLRIV